MRGKAPSIYVHYKNANQFFSRMRLTFYPGEGYPIVFQAGKYRVYMPKSSHLFGLISYGFVQNVVTN
jgi:hypothetical protein